MQVTGAARVHGIDGVEISARCISQVGERTEVEYTFIEQLTETHCRTLAVCCREEGFHDYITFLDGEGFLPDWGFSRYGQTWSRMLPDNDRLTTDGETYVHWYDCVTDSVLGEA